MTRRHQPYLFLIGSSLLPTLLCPIRPAAALTVSEQITPKNLDSPDLTFRVHVTRKDDLLQFELTVEPHGRRLSPFLFGDLELYSDNGHVGYIRVEPERTKAQVRYWFRVSDRLTANSRFTFRENAYQTVKDPDGRSHDEIFIGGREYWFRVGDFTEPSKP